MIDKSKLIQEAERTVRNLRDPSKDPEDVQAAIHYLVKSDALDSVTALVIIAAAFGYNLRNGLSDEDRMHVENAARAAFGLPPAASPMWMKIGEKVLCSGHIFTIEQMNGSYVALRGPIAKIDAEGDARAVPSTREEVCWERVTSNKLFPFYKTILPRSFRGLLKLADEQCSGPTTKST